MLLPLHLCSEPDSGLVGYARVAITNRGIVSTTGGEDREAGQIHASRGPGLLVDLCAEP